MGIRQEAKVFRRAIDHALRSRGLAADCIDFHPMRIEISGGNVRHTEVPMALAAIKLERVEDYAGRVARLVLRNQPAANLVAR